MTGPDQISICHVLNAVDETSTEAEWAVRQTAAESVDRVTILTFFGAGPFEGDDQVSVVSLDIPEDHLVPRGETYRELQTILADHSIVHTHHNHSGTFAKIAAWQTDTPVIVTEHNNHEGFTLKGRIGNGLTNVVADEVICVSESVQNSFSWWERLFLRGEESSVVRNGVDLDRIQSARTLNWSVHDRAEINPEAVLVGSAGMLTEQKAHEVLVEAVDLANQCSDRPVELVISGEGPRREALERQIERAAFPDRIHLLGFLEKREYVYKMLYEVDVYAMPSRWEGFCVAALEAMAAGTACVFSDIPAFEGPFGDAARIHPADDSRALADELLDLASSPSTRADLAERGRSLVTDNYSLQSTVDAYVERYHSYARSGRP